MEVTVTLRLEVAPTADLDEVEQALVLAARQAMSEALQATVRAVEEHTGCPACGQHDRRWIGTSQRVVLVSWGRVRLRLRRVCCRGCQQRYRPAVGLLTPLAGSNTSARLRAACVWAGSGWPFATAARMLAELLGATVSAEQIRQLVLADGRQEALLQQAAAQAVVAPSATDLRAQHAAATVRTRHGSRPVPLPAPPAQLLVGMDGGWVPSREQAGGMEGKVGVVATERVPIGDGRHCLRPRRYVATFQPAAELGDQLYAAADAVGGTRSPCQVVLGDGAEWIKHQAARHFPEATPILDWPHVWRVVERAIRTACPGAANRERRRALYQALGDDLWGGKVAAVTTALRELAGPDGATGALAEALTYLETQQDWLGDYAAWQAAGYPVGSGLVERAVAVVINWRMKDRGMRWTRAMADGLVALRVARINKDWEQAMAALPTAA